MPKENGPQSACWKTKKILIGRQALFLCTKITKLIVFQSKLLHRRLATNIFLTKTKLKDNEQCAFCQNDRETLVHLFCTCGTSSLFWQGFKQWGINRGELRNIINLTPCLILGLKPNKNKSINFYFLIARFFIWTCKIRVAPNSRQPADLSGYLGRLCRLLL